MWQRHLLFLGLVVGAVIALGANLVPPLEPKPTTTYAVTAYHASDFQTVVEQVNTSFRRHWNEQNFQPATEHLTAGATIALCSGPGVESLAAGAVLIASSDAFTPFLQPALPAPDLAVARRLALGLMGTIPSLEEIRQFEWLPTEERLPWWIDHILKDRRSADYLAERFARAFVGTEDGPFILYRRRRFVTWLGDQLFQGKAYDQIVRDLITAKGLWTSAPATNFITVTAQPTKQNQPDSIRLAGRITRAFLGLRLDCAQCHNHPFAEWKQADFQGLAAYFAQTHVGFTGIYDGEGEFEAEDRKTQEKRILAPRVPFGPEFLPGQGNRRQRLAGWITHPKNPYFARAAVNRIWALLVGRPPVEPVDNLESDNPAPPALQILADDFAAHNFDLRRLIRIIACTQAFRANSSRSDEDEDRNVTEAEERAWAAFPLSRLRPEQVVGGLIQSSSVTTIDSESHILVRIARFGNQNDFVKRYGDTGEDDFEGRGGTIPQRLLMLNGLLLNDRIKEGLFNAATRIAWQSPNNSHAVESAYLAVLTRRPTAEESAYFEKFLAEDHPGPLAGSKAETANKAGAREAVEEPPLKRAQRLEDIFWALINSTEFSWNH